MYSFSQSVSQSGIQSIDQLVFESVSQLVGRLVSQSVIESVSQLVIKLVPQLQSERQVVMLEIVTGTYSSKYGIVSCCLEL